MSNWLITQVYGRQVGALGQSAVMALMADAANDDGTGIWRSKQTMAEALGMTKRGVMKVIDALVAAGLLVQVGQRNCINGFTVEYAIALDRLMELPIMPGWKKRLEALGTPEHSSPLPVNVVHPSVPETGRHRCTEFTPPLNEVHPTPEPRSPKPSLTLQEPTRGEPASKQGKRKTSVKMLMPDNWQPEPLPDDLAKLVALWPADRQQRELREFREYWIERGERRPGWDRTWRKRIGDVHDRVMRDSRHARQTGTSSSASDADPATAFMHRMARHQSQREAGGRR